MKKALILALVALSPVVVLAEPPKTIDISKLPAQSKLIDDVVVPVPS